MAVVPLRYGILAFQVALILNFLKQPFVALPPGRADWATATRFERAMR